MDGATLIIMAVAIGGAAGATWLFTGATIWLYKKFGWDKKHTGKRQAIKDTHQGMVPRGGGLAIFGGIVIMVEVVILVAGGWSLQMAMILGGGLLVVVMGVLDDIYDLPAIPRLIINLLVGGMVVGAGLTIDFISHPLGEGVIELGGAGSIVPLVVTLVYVTALMNITNWSKGVDGQMPGMVAIAALFIGGIAFNGEYLTGLEILSGIVAGSFLGFLGWNFYPQKIMPGYGGGALAGYCLAVLSILAGAKIATVFMVLAVPVADAAFTILRRIIAGKSIFLGDRGHLHHKLLDKMGWGRRRIAVFYWGVTVVMGVLALVLPTWGKIVAFVMVIILVWYFLIRVKLQSRVKA